MGRAVVRAMGWPQGRGPRGRSPRALLAAVLAAIVVVVEPVPAAAATPTMTTQASAGGFPVGSPVFDVATLSGGVDPTGTITFDLYRPSDPTCAGPPVFTAVETVNGNGTYTSDTFISTEAGTYQFVARYSGDANNTPVATVCGDPAEQVFIAKRMPTLATQAQPLSGAGTISDTATLTNGAGPGGPTGTITFTLFGPDNLTCSGPPIFTSVVPVAGNGAYISEPFTPTVSGTYQWMASYSGDANNAPAFTLCVDPAEQVVVTLLPGLITPTLTTTASPSVPAGGQVSDSATLAGGVNPTGTVTFRLFGPNDVTCTGPPAFTTMTPVAGNGTYGSQPFTATAPGTYRWVAAYSGDIAHNPVTTACGDPAETVVVTPAGGGGAITVDKTASPASLPEPGGQFGFTVTVTNGGAVAVTITGVTDDIHGDLATRPGSTCGPLVGTGLQPSQSASCTFTGTFTGNAGASQTDTVTVTAQTSTGTAVTDTDDATVTLTGAAPSVAVAKTATPPSLPPPGGVFTFGVQVTNTGGEPVTITDLTDDVYGNLTTVAGSTCTTAPGTTLTAAGTYSCTFPGSFTGAAGASQTDTVTVTVRDDEGTVATATDSATVAITNVVGQIVAQKSVSPASRPEPGGDFTFTVTVTNTGATPLTVTALTDDVAGDLNGLGTCAIGAVLAPNGASYSCAFTSSFTGNAGASETDTLTATAVDAGGAPATATAQATVRIVDAAPAVSVLNQVSSAAIPEQGGPVTHTVTVSNTGAEPVRIVSLVDSVYGDLSSRPGSTCTTAPGTVLAPGANYTCTFTASVTGEAGFSLTDTVSATVVDDEGTTAVGAASATVVLTDVPPRVDVDLGVSPQSRPEPGGTFTYTVTVRNLSNPEAVTITSLTSTTHGDLNGRGTCRVGVMLAPPPQPGSTSACSFVDTVLGDPGSRVTQVTVTVVDNEGTAATATSDPLDGTVTLTDVLPSVAVDKRALLSVLPAPGGPFVFVLRVTNTGPEPLVIASITDDVHGNLAGQGTCATGAALAGGQHYLCVFPALFTGSAGDRETDVITVTVVDNEGNRVQATDDATVTLTGLGLLIPPAPPAPPVVPGPAGTPTGALAFTGTNVGGTLRLAGVLVLAGMLALGMRPRRPLAVARPSNAASAGAGPRGLPAVMGSRWPPAAGVSRGLGLGRP